MESENKTDHQESIFIISNSVSIEQTPLESQKQCFACILMLMYKREYIHQ